MGKRPEHTFLQTGHSEDGQQAHEKMFNITVLLGSTSRNHELASQKCQNGYYQ